MTTNVSISRSTWLVRCPACKKPQKIHASHCYACGSRLETSSRGSTRPARTSSGGGRSVASRPGGSGARARISHPSRASRGPAGSNRPPGSVREIPQRTGRAAPTELVVSPRLGLSAIDLSTIPTRPDPPVRRAQGGRRADIDISTIPTGPNPPIRRVQGSKKPVVDISTIPTGPNPMVRRVRKPAEVDWSAIPTLPNPTVKRPQVGKRPASIRSKRFTSLTYEAAAGLAEENQLPDPQPKTRQPARTTRRLEPVEELAPPLVEVSEEEPTLILTESRRVPIVPVQQPDQQRAPEEVESGDDEYVPTLKPYHTLTDNTVSKLRWWLLRPGRMEFILWVSGTIFLIFLTCALILDSIFNLVTLSSSGHLMVNSFSPTSQTAPMTSLTLLNKGTLLPDSRLRIEGTGFSAHAMIVFFFDEAHPILDADGTPKRIVADGSGHFIVLLEPTKNSGWTAGKHFLVASEPASHRSAALGPLIILAK